MWCDSPDYQVIPTPNEVVTGVGDIDLNEGEWSVVFDEALEKQAKFLAATLGMEAYITTDLPTDLPTDLRTTTTTDREHQLQSRRTLRIRKSASVLVNGEAVESEAYCLVVDAATGSIEITATDNAGAFYGAQSLLQLLTKQQREGR
jgi:N-acetyl-beta-hexosaminidase